MSTIKVSSGKLKNNYRCKTYREHAALADALDYGKKTRDVYEKAVVIKQSIKAMLLDGMKKPEAEKKVHELFSHFDYPTDETRQRHAADALRQISYALSEDRIPVLADEKQVSPFGLLDVDVKPDLIFKGMREFPRYTLDEKGRKKKYMSLEPYIEVVKLRCSKPDVTMRGKRKDAGIMTCLELYCMLMYARELAGDEDLNIGASYYFLRRKNDTSDNFDADFFEQKNAGNIVTLWDQTAPLLFKSYPGYKTEVDRIYEPQFQAYVEGEEECDKAACEKCPLKSTCNFTKPPKYAVKEIKQKSLKDLILTDAQEEVIGFRKGFARVNAGAGAGKTMCVALRTAFLLTEGVPASKICLLTFTNTGAAEMRERIALYVEDLGCPAEMVEGLTTTTFNAFGDKIIRENYIELGFKEEPRLIDEVERSRIIAGLLDGTTIEGLDYRNFNMNMPYVKGALVVAKTAFDVIKRENVGIGEEEKLCDLLSDMHGIGTKTCAQLLDLYSEYDEELREKCLIEYSDQEMLIFELLKKNPFYFEDYDFQHIIVDEFQDTSALEFAILKNMIDSSLNFQSFLVVGDDSQSIFGFKGTTPEFIINFEKNLGEEVQDMYLLENHRSTKRIIDFANKINALNVNRVEKDLIATREDGDYVHVEAFWKKEDEDKYVVELIKKKMEAGTPLEDIAYIASTRAQLLRMGTILSDEGIQWIMLNPEPLSSNSRVQGALALARYLYDTTSTADAFCYLNAASKSEMLARLSDAEIQKKLDALSDLAIRIPKLSEKDRVNGLRKLLESLDDEDEIYRGFLEKIYLRRTYYDMISYMRDFDLYGENEAMKRNRNYPGVVLTTAHSSKGMEWPVIINEISKYHTQRMTLDEVEEKRRLLFVSCTRARDELHVIGQVVAHGSKGKSIFEDTRVVNQFLEECYEIQGKKLPEEP